MFSWWVGQMWARTASSMSRPERRSAVTARPLYSVVQATTPEWTEMRVLQRPWFPAELEIQRADALVWAPAAFRKHGVYLSVRDLEGA
jgi:hypothetical protein